ncbi:MAG: FkbM family methyltransferase [Myxococcaceae bacterium]
MNPRIEASLRLFRLIAGHPIAGRDVPAALLRVLRWQVVSRLAPGEIAVPYVENTRLLMRRGMTGATGNYYLGLHEFEEMGFLLHLLRSDDLFFDVGANVGSYTVLASGVVGARTCAFEPVPATVEHLRANVAINRLESRVEVFQVGVGAEPGELQFTADLDCVNHVVPDQLVVSDRPTVRVPVQSLAAFSDRMPLLLKIDVEGYEPWVIQGAEPLLRDERLLALILETNGSSRRYGLGDADCHASLIAHGFETYSYDPLTRALAPLSVPRSEGNTLYVRSLPTIRRRLSTAPRRRIHRVQL